jgi:uncharacterized protein with PQ loop repeat
VYNYLFLEIRSQKSLEFLNEAVLFQSLEVVRSKEERSISIAILAILVALSVLGLVAITVSIIPVQEAEAGMRKRTRSPNSV